MSSTHQPIVNIEAAIYKDNRYLIVQRSEQEDHASGTLSLVGGQIHTRDTQADDVLLATLQRGITEEVGVQITDMRYVTSSIFRTDEGETVLNIVFLARYADGIATAADPNEVEEVYWMTAAQVLGHHKAPAWTRDYIQQCEALRQTLA